MRIGILGYGNLGRGVECRSNRIRTWTRSGIYKTCAGNGINPDEDGSGLLCS